VELTLPYTTLDISCRHRRHECDGGIKYVMYLCNWLIVYFTLHMVASIMDLLHSLAS